ncbi:uncharacterized protein [Clytia hemisphaerica]|uniref:uncharacterized protein n=1 Tax=Clytia hemisphaerica TaxID=252671 RepID=UPI0034D6ABE4
MADARPKRSTKSSKFDGKRIVVYFPETSSYSILSEASSIRRLEAGARLGDNITVKDKGVPHSCVIKFIGSFDECESRCYEMEKEIRRENNESTIDTASVRDSPSSPTFEDPLPQHNTTRTFAPPPLPTLPGGHASSPIGLMGELTRQSSNRMNRRKTSDSDLSVKLLEDVLKEAQKTNSLLEKTNSLLEKFSNSQSDAASGPSEPTLNREEFMHNNECLLDVARESKPTKYALKLARILWSEDERQNGIIEPGKSTYTGNQLNGQRLDLLKRLLVITIPATKKKPGVNVESQSTRQGEI